VSSAVAALASPPREVVEQAARDLRRQLSVARRHRADRLDQPRRRGVLEQEAAGSGPDRVVDVLVEIERRQHEDAGGVAPGEQPARRLDAVQSRHPHVHQHDVRPAQAREFDRLGAVRGLGHDVHVLLGVEDHAEAAPDQGLVVGDDHADHERPVGSRARTR
jgi:hypothetical protein